ncbi:DNA-binding IclR family transcriptional regulator [Duganella sp. 1411]|uniref:ArsR family transcriptional regulator n=1 Tax=Duganella sp. 1411 TaxID=2806572 RepID=UPI001AE36C05|nr:ArsR family transcriptional regulator [Duganella sp. 1411]MBP1204996.1 DNA-binding IclR family transcriptional regulator [Duganella sp. 1411]
MDDEVMAALVDVLETLWRIEARQPGKPCSLAKLSKQAQRPMSVLRRQLLMLVEAGWIELRLDEGGITGSVRLSASGLQLGGELFS